jgi:hypothetical protein
MPGLNPWLKQSKIDIEYANPVMQITQFLYPRFDLPVGETPRIRELVNFGEYLYAYDGAHSKVQFSIP